MRNDLATPGAKPVWLVIGLAIAAMGLRLAAQSDQQIYTDSLQNGWQNWGWATIDYNNSTPTHSGSASISVTIANNSGQAIYIAHAAFDSSPYTNLTFWINGGASGGQQLLVQGHAGGNYQAATNLPALAANTWRQFSIPLAALGVANRPDMDGFWIQDRIGAVQPTFYLDDLTLVAGSNAPPATNTPVSIAIDANLNRHPISPLIYGVAFATSNQLSDLNYPLNRSGGNSETRNNWQLNAHNHAADWYFQSLDDFNGGDPRATIPGANADQFVADTKNGGGQPLLTVPMIGWLPKLGPSRGKLASYSIAKYGPQTGNDWQWMADAGNGVGTNSAAHTSWLITTNDMTDANFQTNSTYQAAWLQHLTNRWGVSTNGGVRYYLMDNEHSIWHSTHRDVHPGGANMAEIRDKFFDYAGMVKTLDPNALVLFPEEFGWSGYFNSGYDLWWGNLHGWGGPMPDRTANGGMDYMPWLLSQLYQHAATNGNQRLLDYFTLHCYPEDNNVAGNDVSTSTQLLRNRLTRKFWDPNYVDETWISQPVKLIPRMKSWVAGSYPGTKIGITEYNWGAEGHINGATAQADILGIFGRESLDLATRWTTPATTSPTYKAMKLYRNYDANKSAFGDASVSATGPNPDLVSTFAAVRTADGALTVMMINKQLSATATATFSLSNFLPGGPAQLWQLTSANAITRLSDVAFTGSSFSNTVPLQSITLFVIPALRTGLASKPNPTNGAVNVALNTTLSWLPGSNAISHRLFFGSSLAAVAGASTNSPEFKGSLATTNYTPAGLALSATYFWRVDEVAATYANTGTVWSFTTPMVAGVASNPNPANGATNVAINTSLSWTAGVNATSHQVYFGANSNSVLSATTNSPEFKGALLTTAYSPPANLASSGRFFWRVDALAGTNPTVGPVWTFATTIDPFSKVAIAGLLGSGDQFVLNFPSQIGQTYRVERTENLSSPIWSLVADNLAGTGAAQQIINSGVSAQSQRFYRVIILPP